MNTPSAQSYADHIRSIIESYDSDSLHIIANGFGTVVATHFLNASGSKARSLTLFEPEGVLEFELLGGYHLNRGVYQINNALSWSVRNLLPDFGYFENTWLNDLYSRTRLNTDLRQVPSLYNRIQTPTIIINPKQNVESVNRISSELNRLIVTSDLLNPASGRNSSTELIQSFINNPTIADRDASVSRKVKSLIPFSYSKIINAEGWILTGLMLLIIFSTFIFKSNQTI